jgi:hypothetical protein
MKLIPAGVSKKTGKPYEAFWACPNSKMCGGKTILYVPEEQEAIVDFDQGERIFKKLNELDKKIDALDNRITEMAKWLAGRV